MPRLDTRLDLERLGSRILPSASPVAAHSARSSSARRSCSRTRRSRATGTALTPTTP
jgi:hypothetical protein